MKSIKLFTVAIVIASIFTVSCDKEYTLIEGEGAVVTRTLAVDSFTGIELQGVDDVIVSYGTEQSVSVTGHSNIIDRIETEVSNGTWKIKLENGRYRNYELTYYLTMPDVARINNIGTGDVIVNDFINGGDLEVLLTGTGDVEMNKMENVEQLTVYIEGTGSFVGMDEFPGLKNLDISIIGLGNFYGFPVQTEDCIIHVEGDGNAEVTVSNTLDVTIEGIGHVYYKGSPSITQSITGLGSIVDKNN